jgi:hypothetical protein
MKVDKARLGEIATILIAHKYKKELTAKIQSMRREIGQLAKDTGIPEDELKQVMLEMANSLVEWSKGEIAREFFPANYPKGSVPTPGSVFETNQA